jgi:Peptidase family S41/PDZ domain
MISKLALLALLFSPGLLADLTLDQKISDFTQLAGLYAKNYGPYQWKVAFLGFDLYDIQPWLDQVRQTKTDLDYYDVCVHYVASLQDSHDEFTILSDFEAYLHFDVDIYDGVVLIDSIDRTALPQSKYPFQIGDQVVSIDGIAVEDFITKLIPYSVNGSGSQSTRRRLAVDNISFRYQGFYIHAHEIGDTSTVVIQRQNGNMESYTIAWEKIGTPLISAGPVASPVGDLRKAHAAIRRARSSRTNGRGDSQTDTNPWGVYEGPPAETVPMALPDYQQVMVRDQQMVALSNPFAAASFGATAPVFNPPAGFKRRLGANATDQFYSGTFTSGNHTYGLIRIYTMEPTNEALALTQFQTEMTFFQNNTDGLMIDIMRNGGGSLCYTELLAQYVMPTPFRSIPEIIRATSNWVSDFSEQYYDSILDGAPTWQTELYGVFLKTMQQANAANRGDTGDLPLCYAAYETVPPAMDRNGNNIAYTKPILVLTDDFTLSAAETFGAILQDGQRATFFGTRTDGGGGNVVSFDVGVYGEGQARVTLGLETRKAPVSTPGYPTTNYIENVGIYPDIYQDYMTKDNLLNGGTTFLNAAITALNKLVGN